MPYQSGNEMEAAALTFLQTMLSTPSPSGYEEKIQQVVRDYAAGFADEISTDIHGNVILVANPGCETRVMLDGHCDQIGMLISHIDEKGFLYAQPIGGWDPQQLIGQRMTIWARGGPLNAVIARKPIHLLNESERKQVVKIQELWLDIGAKDGDEAAELVQVGDPVTLQLGFQPLLNDFANAPGMDNRCGVWVVVEAMRRAKAAGLDCSLYVVSSVQEEIGLRGVRTSAFSVDPQIGIAVDVTHATDCPTMDQRQQGDIKVGAGPVVFRGPNMNHKVVERLQNVAAAGEIPYQMSAIGRAASNDSNALQVNRGGVATGLVSVPNRYMHSAVETICLTDLDQAASLLAGFASGVRAAADFIPG